MHLTRLTGATAAVAVCAALAIPAVATAGSATVVGTAKIENAAILADSRGHTLYMATHDRNGRSSCYGACAKTWKPLLTGNRVVAKRGSHVNQRLLGTVKRNDGKRQVTYNKHPLYLYSQDGGRGQDYGQGCSSYGSTWWMVGTNGKSNTTIISICQGY